MPRRTNSETNPFVNGFRLRREIYDFYLRRAEVERRTLSDMIRIVLEDHASDPTQKPEQAAA